MSRIETGRGPRVGRMADIALLMYALAASLLALEVLGPKSAGAVGNIEELNDHEPDRDFRTGSVNATRSQRAAVSDLGASPPAGTSLARRGP
jgi:hypothetical protein